MELKLKLKRNFSKVAVFFVAFIVLISCGKDETTSAPSPLDLDPPTDPFDPAPPPDDDTRVPDLEKAVTVALTDPVNFSGLEDIANFVFAPLVGDPLVSMDLLVDRSTGISGSILVAFEDQIGFWGAILNSFKGTSTISSGALDMIFADDELVLRTIGTISGDTLNGTIYYRVRVTGDDECKPVTVTCQTNTTPGDPFCQMYPWYPTCQANPNPNPPECDFEVDTVTPCLSYMSISNSSVKDLGSFSNTTFSNWVR